MRGLSFNHLSHVGRTDKNIFLKAFDRVLTAGVFLQGNENLHLTQTLTKRFGKHILLVGSGHDAIQLSLQALSLAPRDEVIIPANAYPTAFAVALSGAKMVLADVDMQGQLTIEAIKHVATPRTKVVIMVHMYGLTGDVVGVKNYCAKHKYVFIEDCAQSFGTTFAKKQTGTFGDIGCFSFYPTKNIGAFGDGGALWVKNVQLASQISALCKYGEQKRYESTRVAGHSRLPELQAAGIRVSLSLAKKDFMRRKKVATWYIKALDHASLTGRIRVLYSHAKSNPVIHLFVIAAKHRDTLQKYLATNHIPTNIHYPHPIHLVKAFAHLRHRKGAFPNSELLAREILSLPYHARMTKSDILRVAHLVRIFYEKHP